MWTLPGTPSTSGTPKMPAAVTNTRMQADRIAGADSGSVMRIAVWNLEAPDMRAASSSEASMLCRLPSVNR